MNFLHKVLRNTPMYNPTYLVVGIIGWVAYDSISESHKVLGICLYFGLLFGLGRLRKWKRHERPDMTWQLVPGYAGIFAGLVLVGVVVWYFSHLVSAGILILGIPIVLMAYYTAEARLAHNQKVK